MSWVSDVEAYSLSLSDAAPQTHTRASDLHLSHRPHHFLSIDHQQNNQPRLGCGICHFWGVGITTVVSFKFPA